MAVAAGLLFTSAFGRTPAPLDLAITKGSLRAAAAGVILTALGLLLALWARATLGTNWSGAVTLKQDHELIERGPYAFVRHPIYSALLLMFLGTALAAGTLGAFLGLPLAALSFWIKLRQEEAEALVLRHFPERYREYRARVSALIPFVI